MKTQSSLTSVTSLPNQSQDNQARIVKILEDYLEKAKAGEMREVLLCYLIKGESAWGNASSTGLDFPQAIGMLYLSIHEWISNYNG